MISIFLFLSSVPICLRCHGTVEGPKYSTCKCKIPAMTPEDLNKSSTIFGGFMNAIRRPSTKPFSLAQNQSPDTTPKGSISESLIEFEKSPANSSQSVSELTSAILE